MTDFIDAATGEILPNTEDNVTVAFAIYQQEAARQPKWRTHRYLTEAFKKSIKARLEEAGGIAAWREAIEISSKSEWLTGKIDGKDGRPFQMDLNFLLRPASFEKVLSGFYTRDEPPAKLVLPSMQPPHLKPQPAFVPEHPDIRDAAAIISWRKIGRYDKANEVEERFAKRQGRPPVLVPAPEVAREGMAPRPAPAPRKPAPTITDVPDWTAEEVPASAYHEVEA